MTNPTDEKLGQADQHPPRSMTRCQKSIVRCSRAAQKMVKSENCLSAFPHLLLTSSTFNHSDLTPHHVICSCAELLDSLLRQGRISTSDSELISSHLRTEDTSDVIWRGNVTVCCRRPDRLVEVTFKVLNTVELLENILTFLTPSAQLRMRSVCGEFQRVIDDSPHIRKSMFRKEAASWSPSLQFHTGSADFDASSCRRWVSKASVGNSTKSHGNVTIINVFDTRRFCAASILHSHRLQAP